MEYITTSQEQLSLVPTAKLFSIDVITVSDAAVVARP